MPEMSVTARQLNRATLARQLLLAREPVGVVEAVHRVVALQAQEPASPYLALWNRVAGFDPADLDAAFAAGTVVKATLMRVTLHAVDAADHPAFHAAMVLSLRAARLNDPRYTGAGLTVADADALLPELLEYAATEPRTKFDAEALCGRRHEPEATRWMWWALKTFAPLRHAPTGGTWSYGPRAAYVAATAPAEPVDPQAAAQHLAYRYLEGFGPATPADLARFTLLTRTAARAALRGLGAAVRTLTGPDGTELWDVADGPPVPDGDTPAPPRLLGMWDSVLLAYADRSRLVDPEHRAVVTRNNGDVLATLLVDGYVAGVWRPVEGGIEAAAFRPLAADAWDGLAAEARALVRFLAGRDPAVYRRYNHWWAKIPAAETRLLPG
jgi:hypothetical protein